MRTTTFQSAARWLVGGVGLMLLLPVLGCSAGEGKVTGRVLFNGAPLPGGRVTFRPEDPTKNSVSAELDDQGNYEAALPAGGVMVSVDNRTLAPRAKVGGVPKDMKLAPDVVKALGGGGKAEPPADKPKDSSAPDKAVGKYIPIPNKYYDAETSGLEFKVERGGQKHDIEMTK